MAARELVLPCPSCQSKNRVPATRFKDGPVCGKCKARLPLGGEPFEVGDDVFQSAVLEAPLPVLVDFWAVWCGPCKAVAPALETVAREMAGKALVAKCNVDENPGAAARYQIQGIPTMVLFSGGREVDRLVGAAPREQIAALVQRAVH